MRPISKGNSPIRSARQRLVLCRLMIDIMRNLHGAYAPKIAAYMRVPRTTVIRRLGRLQSWGLIHRQGHRYYMDQRALNSLLGMRSYQHIRRLIHRSVEELSVLDTLPD